MDTTQIIAAAAVGLTAFGAIVAWLTYLGSERWKEAEFLAREMKDFLGSH
jgi:hypothetical protein